MAYKLKKNKSKRSNYGSKRSVNSIKYLVFHYTGNDGDTDEANANYFHNNTVEASAHAFVDDDSVTISVPATYVAWSVGSNGLLDQASAYASKGGKWFGKCTNANSYSIEMCDTERNGKREVTKETRKNAILYGAKIMKKYNIPIQNVIRHFDVNGKLCPIYFVTSEDDWTKFKIELLSAVKGDDYKPQKYSGTFPTLPKRGYFKIGDKGVNVKRLQMFLNWANKCKLEVDGQFGSKTESQILSFQYKYDLVADGLFGKESLAKARKVMV